MIAAVHASADVDHDVAAHALIELYDQRIALTMAFARADRPTGAMAREILDVGTRLDVECERFRRRFYPRRAEVIVGLWTVMVCSPTRRSITSVLDLSKEYGPRDAARRRTGAASERA